MNNENGWQYVLARLMEIGTHKYPVDIHISVINFMGYLVTDCVFFYIIHFVKDLNIISMIVAVLLIGYASFWVFVYLFSIIQFFRFRNK